MASSQSRLGSPMVYAAVGASVLAIPATAAALGTPAGPSGSGPSIKLRVKRTQIRYGHEVVAFGDAPVSASGETVALQFLASGTGAWQQIASARVAPDGSFRLVAPLNRSGWLQATMSETASSSGTGPVATSSSTGSSSPAHVAVAAGLHLRARAINELGPRRIDVRGLLLSRVGGRRVLLQGERDGRWVTLSAAHTSRRGTFSLRYRPTGTVTERLRVRFAGDSSNAGVARPAGSLSVYRPSVASWYYDGGTTGCGFHARYGVANVSLPCGTHVRFFYGGRTVDAVVDDRGPYVGGRTWDLNQTTAAALGFGGVGTIWSSR